MRLGAAQLPYLRRELVAFESSARGAAWRANDYESGRQEIRSAYTQRQWAVNNLDCLTRMELFHVTEEMTRLCVAAATSLEPLERLSAADFPARIGYMFWSGDPIEIDTLARTGEQRDVCAIRWAIADNQSGLYWWWYEERDGGTVPEGVSREVVSTLNPRACEFHSGILQFGEGGRDVQFPLRDRVFIATCLLMQQHVSRREAVAQQRHSRKADERAEIEPKPVTVIALRRVHAEGSTPTGEGRDYSHRWIVGGHWRNHWYPKRGVHRPVWIAPYVKGPDDKPLVLKERVTSLMR